MDESRLARDVNEKGRVISTLDTFFPRNEKNGEKNLEDSCDARNRWLRCARKYHLELPLSLSLAKVNVRNCATTHVYSHETKNWNWSTGNVTIPRTPHSFKLVELVYAKKLQRRPSLFWRATGYNDSRERYINEYISGYTIRVFWHENEEYGVKRYEELEKSFLLGVKAKLLYFVGFNGPSFDAQGYMVQGEARGGEKKSSFISGNEKMEFYGRNWNGKWR